MFLFSLFLLAGGSAFVVAGVLSYTGQWRARPLRQPYNNAGMLYMGLGALVWGVLALVMAITRLWTESRPPEAWQWILSGFMFAGALVFWFGVFFGRYGRPRFLRPPWMRAEDEDGHDHQFH
ncbi:hypothetical protein [Brevibacterium litoralis]|uniref:hypothetical protein n=1 Tax=Brevibacterium litoralis TaxID=3138935 RepID=UPI0032EC5A1E